jgi:hypothetical protein
MSVKHEVLTAWQERAAHAQSAIQEIEPRLARLRYEYEIAQRLLAKAPDEAARQTWDIQVSVQHDFMVMAEGELAEQQEDLALCAAMIAEIEADLAGDQPQQ